MSDILRFELLYVIGPVLGFATLPFLFPFNTMMWVYYIIFWIVNGFCAWRLIKFYKNNEVPIWMAFIGIDKMKSKSGHDLFATAGLMVSLLIAVMAISGLLGVIYFKSGNALFAIVLIMIFLIFIVEKKLKRKIMQKLFEIASAVRGLRIIGILLPFVLETILFFVIRFYLIEYPNWSFGCGLLFFSISQHFYYMMAFFLSLRSLKEIGWVT